MHSKEEAQNIRKSFWTAFGIYMKRHVSRRGPKLKWLNYKTGIRHIYFRCHIDNKLARVSIDLHHSDAGIRSLVLEQFREFQHILEEMTGGNWIWVDQLELETGEVISRIYKELAGVNIYKQTDWHGVFPFFEDHLLVLDEFWADTEDVFQSLVS